MPKVEKKEGELGGGACTYEFVSPKTFYGLGTINSVFQNTHTTDMLKIFKYTRLR